MSEFLVEVFVPLASTLPDRSNPSADIAVVEELAREGHPVTLTRSVLLPNDETRFLLFRAESQDEVREAAGRLGLRCDRISEAISDWVSQ